MTLARAVRHIVGRYFPCRLIAGLGAAITIGTAEPLAAQGPSGGSGSGIEASAGQSQREERVRVVLRDYPSLRVGRNLRIDLHAKLDVDRLVRPPGAPPAKSAFDMSRKRIGIEGSLFGFMTFQVEREIQTENPWRDVFVDLRARSGLRVRAGKFKMPFSMDRLTSPSRLDFVQRSRIGDVLAPGRDVGVALHGRVWRRALSYDAGVFAHGGDATRIGTATVTSPTGAGRITVRPIGLFAGSDRGRELEIGANVTIGRVDEGLHSLGGRTASGSTIAEAVYVKGQRVRLGLDAAWAFRSISLKSEFLGMADERLGQGVFGNDLDPLVLRGWYVSGTWVVAGEEKSDEITPRRPLFRGGIGAVEIAARRERMTSASGSGTGQPSRSPRASDLHPADARLWTLGVNWYLNRWIKVQANLVRDELAPEDEEPVGDRVSWTKLFRLQFSM